MLDDLDIVIVKGQRRISQTGLGQKQINKEVIKLIPVNKIQLDGQS